MTLRTKYDVAIVGGGPVGCVTALAFARKGAKVVVLEADPRAAHRFAGEWLHPAGVGVLDRLRAGRLDLASPRTGYGFVIVPDDGGPAVQMPYASGIALSAEHSDIVASLREAVREAGVELVENVRVLGVDGHVVRGEDRLRRRPVDLEAARIVGADGRSSMVRQSLGFPDRSQVLSYMACVELRDVDLPFPGFGHVVLGGPGPMLLYRIGDGRVRGCLDVPLTEGPRSRSAAYLWDAFAHLMPAGTKDAFRDSLSRAPLVWAANRFRPRSHFGRDHVALVGDAVGHTHPMTALGMTNGFLDAVALADAGSIAEYEAARRAHVPEVLSNALYHCFRRTDPGATSLRVAMMEVLRSDPAERDRTLRIMAGDDASKRSFGTTFMRMAAHAASRVVKDAPRRRDVPERLVALAEWMQWPVAGLLPQRLMPRGLRARASTKSPLPMVEKVNDAFRAPPRREPEGKLSELDPAAAIEVGSERLLRDLEALAHQFGSTPDHELALPALKRLRAIELAMPSLRRGGVAMGARLTMARRRLAREGAPRLLGLVANGVRDQWVAEDLAELFTFVLAGPEPETVVGLLEGVRALTSCGQGGGFGLRPGAPTSLATTEIVLRALLDARSSTDLPSEVRERLERSKDAAVAYVRSCERGEGHFASTPSATIEGGAEAIASAMQILVLGGVPATDPLLRRAVRALGQYQSDDGSFGSVSITARSLAALLAAAVPTPDVTLRAARVLCAAIEHDELAGESLALALGGLGAYAALRSGRPISAPKARRAVLDATPTPVRAEITDEPTATPKEAPAPPRSRHPEADWAYCKEALGEVSRTFARPIALLPDELEVAVTLGYLLCRVADTVEDHTAVTHDIRDELFTLFLGVLERGEPAEPFAAAFERIPGHDAELDLARQLPRVMDVYRSQSAAMQDATVRWVSEMARGMSLYSHRRVGNDGMIALETVQDLERYCYYVAGTVGHFLTDVFLVSFAERATPELSLALRKDAEDFAAGLQLVNILKDVTDDRARGWSFVPRTACADQGLGVPELVDPERRQGAHDAVAPLFDIARNKLEGALRYALTIPADQSGIRLFCLLPLWMAARTLRVARGNDAMFVAGAPVKISRDEVEAIVAECVKHSSDDDFLRARWVELWQTPEVRAAG
jgi:2-polyprenyl-6-methoxyphenol hydroxylase-like FAD-dependent oxidoreductase/phytoene/squalene synthetase